jgi:hypothetical protein
MTKLNRQPLLYSVAVPDGDFIKFSFTAQMIIGNNGKGVGQAVVVGRWYNKTNGANYSSWNYYSPMEHQR